MLEKMTNDELKAAPRVEAVLKAQLERRGLDAATRDAAATELAKLTKTTREQALIAAVAMFVRAGVFDTGLPDEHRACDQLVCMATAAIAEIAAAHERDRVDLVHLGVRHLAGRGIAAIVDHRDRFVARGLEQRGRADHPMMARAPAHAARSMP